MSEMWRALARAVIARRHAARFWLRALELAAPLPGEVLVREAPPPITTWPREEIRA